MHKQSIEVNTEVINFKNGRGFKIYDCYNKGLIFNPGYTTCYITNARFIISNLKMLSFMSNNFETTFMMKS